MNSIELTLTVSNALESGRLPAETAMELRRVHNRELAVLQEIAAEARSHEVRMEVLRKRLAEERDAMRRIAEAAGLGAKRAKR